MQNLNQLLLEAPDVVDAPRAVALPPASSAVHAKGKGAGEIATCICTCIDVDKAARTRACMQACTYTHRC